MDIEAVLPCSEDFVKAIIQIYRIPLVKASTDEHVSMTMLKTTATGQPTSQ
jgi:hypothetical protein